METDEGLDGGHLLSSDSTWSLYRTSAPIQHKLAHIRQALGRASSEVVLWMQKGSLWRTVFVSSVSIVLLLGFAGLGTFVLFLLAATLNAVAIGFLTSVASVGPFTALFFSFLTLIYTVALIIAVFVISTITFFCICSASTAAGWIAFFWALWQGLKKGINFLKSFFVVRGTKGPPVTIENEKIDEKEELRFVPYVPYVTVPWSPKAM